MFRAWGSIRRILLTANSWQAGPQGPIAFGGEGREERDALPFSRFVLLLEPSLPVFGLWRILAAKIFGK